MYFNVHLESAFLQTTFYNKTFYNTFYSINKT